MALSTVLHSINSPDNSPLSNSVLLVLFLPYWFSQLYISLWKSPSALFIIHCGWLGLKHRLTNDFLGFKSRLNMPLLTHIRRVDRWETRSTLDEWYPANDDIQTSVGTVSKVSFREKFSKSTWSAYGLSQALKCHFELNWTEPNWRVLTVVSDKRCIIWAERGYNCGSGSLTWF